TVSILLGKGDGTFQDAVSFAAGKECQYVAVGDFNGDGKLDLAVANQVLPTVSILLGNGDGTFQDAVPSAASPASHGVVVGDFNGDGKLDLATVCPGSPSTVSLLLG